VAYLRKDARYRQAKKAGYRARSAYKLIELDDKFHLLRPGAAVADIGAWPGGWMQVASERVGPRGRVVGIDVVPIDPLSAPNASTIVGDVSDSDVIEALRTSLGRPADVVLSDAAPKLTGVRARDEARSEDVVVAVVSALPRLLDRGGSFVTKTFMSPGEKALVDDLRHAFARVRPVRLESTRHGSSESYLVALDYHGPA